MSDLAQSTAYFIQEGFDHVGKTRHLVKTKSATASFDGMDDTEDGVNHFYVRRAHLMVYQASLHRIETLEALLKEALIKLCAFIQDAQVRGIDVQWHEPSPAVNEAAHLLDLEGILALSTSTRA